MQLITASCRHVDSDLTRLHAMVMIGYKLLTLCGTCTVSNPSIQLNFELKYRLPQHAGRKTEVYYYYSKQFPGDLGAYISYSWFQNYRDKSTQRLW